MKQSLVTLFIFLSVSCFAQTLEKVAENTVSTTIKVFTYKVLSGSTTADQDTQTPTGLTTGQQAGITHFLGLQGVQNASYDKATNTYTVYTDPSTQIAQTLNLD